MGLLDKTIFSGKTSQETLDDEDDEEEDDNNSSNNETSDSDEAMQVQFDDEFRLVLNLLNYVKNVFLSY